MPMNGLRASDRDSDRMERTPPVILLRLESIHSISIDLVFLFGRLDRVALESTF